LIHLLLATLILMVILFFIINGRDVLFPSIGVTVGFIISTVFLIINENRWEIIIHDVTFFVIISGILILFLGEISAKSLIEYKNSYRVKSISINGNIRDTVLSIKSISLVIITLIMTISFIWFLYHIYKVSIAYGYSENIFKILSYYRSARAPMNPILKILIISDIPIAYFCILVFFDNYYNLNRKKYKYLIPVILYTAIEIVSSNRIGILYLLIVIVSLRYILFKRKHNWHMWGSNLKFITYGIITFVAFLGVFYLLGMLTGKTKDNNFFYIISVYVGSSIAALDHFLVDFEYNMKNFGNETIFYGINSIINLFGINMGLTQSRYLEFVSLGQMGIRTNIYTAFRRLLHDYGILGMIIIQYFTGFVYTHIYCKIKNRSYKNEKLAILIYIYFFRYLILFVIEEKIIVNLFTITTLIQVFLMYLLLKYASTNIYHFCYKSDK
jgi:oligosaccharide repeat unit polymerase